MIVEIINKKRLSQELTKEELEFFFNGYLKKDITDYQMSALLMAICINGMTDREIFDLTKIFIDSGEVLDFSNIKGIKVDKHSTGGVGDKTTLVIAPIVASLGVPVIKMSGRGLGFTGGTIDKLESIPGFRTDLSDQEIEEQVNDIGMVVTGQTSNLVPMDKLIYALRDVTATVESVPLVATSIMSKKIASGADKILIDIKLGKGALIKTKTWAKKLSSVMIKIGKFYGKEVRTIITDMNNPLGDSIGNSIEVEEAIDILNGKKGKLTDLCIELASQMVSMGKEIEIEEAEKQVIETINNKNAYKKFLEFVKYQKGDINKLKISDNSIEIKSVKDGIIEKIDALEIGKLSVKLGAGRENKEDIINPTVGIKLNKLVGDKVKKGDTLCTLFVEEKENYDYICKYFEIN